MSETSPLVLALLLDVSWKIAVVAGAVALALKIGRVGSPALQHAAWRSVLLGMLALPALCLWAPALPVSPPAGFGDIAGTLESLAPAPGASPLRAAPVVASTAVADAAPSPPRAARPQAAALAAATVAPAGSRGWPSWAWLLSGVYGLGVIIMSTRLAGAWWLTRQLVAGGDALDEALWQQRSREILGRRHRRGVRLALHPAIRVPLATGWLWPAVLLPLGWHEWDDATRRCVLTHELMHVRRRDYLVQFLAAVNRCVFWFHPLAWMLSRRLAALAERACDEGVVARLGHRRHYARVLLGMAAAVAAARPRRPIWIGATMLGGGRLSERIEGVLATTGKRRRLGRVAAWSLAGLIAAGVAGAAALRPVPRPEPPAEGPGASPAAVQVTPPARPAPAGEPDVTPAPAPRPAPEPASVPSPAATPPVVPEPALGSPTTLAASIVTAPAATTAVDSGSGPIPFPVISHPSPPPADLDAPAAPAVAIAGAAASAETPPAPSSPAERCGVPHRYILWFDDQNRAVSRKAQVSGPPLLWLEDAGQWIREELCPVDRVAIVSFKGRLRVHQDFTTDREASVRALDEVTRWKLDRRADRTSAGEPSLLNSLPPARELARRSHEVPQALDLLAEAATSIEGRKDLILLSKGFGSWNIHNGSSGSAALNAGSITSARTDRLRASGVVVSLLSTGRAIGAGEYLLIEGTGGWFAGARRDRPSQTPGHTVLAGLKAIARAIESDPGLDMIAESPSQGGL